MSERTWSFVAYTAKEGFTEIDPSGVPEWVMGPWKLAEDPPTMDRMMAQAGAECHEQYGIAEEGIDVWRLNGEWLIQHCSAGALDANIIIRSLLDFLHFQAAWLAPVAAKIMAEAEHWQLRKRIEEETTQENRLKLN